MKDCTNLGQREVPTLLTTKLEIGCFFPPHCLPALSNQVSFPEPQYTKLPKEGSGEYSIENLAEGLGGARLSFAAIVRFYAVSKANCVLALDPYSLCVQE